MRLLLALALVLAVPGAASASTISVVLADGCQGDAACAKYGGAPPVPVTTFQGAAGEHNLVSVRNEEREFVVRDDGALLTPQAPCWAVDAHSARCPVTQGASRIPGFSAGLGDGDDRITVAGDLGVETSISGGDGKDVVEGGAENDSIDGGAGGDRLLGGGGSFDELSYSTRTAPVVVDLGRETGGEPGEDDAVANFEILVGGSGADVLRGTAGRDRLEGGAGDDVLRGRGDADLLLGDAGADRLFGQAGNDLLYGDPEQGDDVYTPIIRLLPDRLDGGRGHDSLHDSGGRNRYLGGPGRDVLFGGDDPDRMDAGPGRDLVDARGGGRDRVRCGAGRDQAGTDRRDTRRGCERRGIPTGGGGSAPVVRRASALTDGARRYTSWP